MLERSGGQIEFACDGCSESLSTGTVDFRKAVVTLGEERWIAIKDGEEWKHYCPTCVEDKMEKYNG